MDAVFVDCTPELNSIIKEKNLPVPEGLRINHGDPAEDELIRLTRSAAVICVEHTPLPVRLLDESPNLRAIIFMGTGAQSYVPVHEARRREIKVLTTPGYGNLAVAEHAMALTFAAARKVALMDRAVRGGLRQPRGGEQLNGSKVAVIGLGGIGQTYARLAIGLGMSGQVGYTGLDVFWKEPLTARNPWTQNNCVTVTPHAAYMTDAAYEELWKRTIDALRSIMPFHSSTR